MHIFLNLNIHCAQIKKSVQQTATTNNKRYFTSCSASCNEEETGNIVSESAPARVSMYCDWWSDESSDADDDCKQGGYNNVFSQLVNVQVKLGYL